MNQGAVILNYLDRFEVYGTVGAMRNHFGIGRMSIISGGSLRLTTVGRQEGSQIIIGAVVQYGLGLEGKIQYGKPSIQWSRLTVFLVLPAAM